MSSDQQRKYVFKPSETTFYLKEFPIAHLPSEKVTISIYGVVRQENNILLQTDYSSFITRGREGIKQPDGRFVWPFIAFKWIENAQHKEFCFVYNLYGEDDSFIGHRRCNSTFVIERC